ncbi:MAG: hydroxymethylbilane synthase, partial [Acidobacteria bacterium]|nr:hydroxymethylbilane synthase [Acidobacteriota bacterium]
MSGAAGVPLRLGTRSSALALAQSGLVARQLEAAHPGLRVELVPFVTQGDRYRGDLSEVGGKGLFTQELEAGLLDGSLDLAVHSLKDLPVELAPGLRVAAYPERADPRDVLVSPRGLDELPEGSSVLTGALRRRAQLLMARPDLDIRPVRGNVGTRLAKWRRGDGDAVVLAAAGLARLGPEGLDLDSLDLAALGLTELPLHPLEPEVLLPAPGQGVLALETLRGSRAEALCAAVDHPATARAAGAERAVVAAFGGDCTLPLAAWGRETADGFRLSA